MIGMSVKEKTSTASPSGPKTAPTIPVTAVDGRTVVAAEWQALGFEVLGFGSAPRRTLAALRVELETLIVVHAWFEAHGNITQVAEDLRTGRRVVRERIAAWQERHPHFVLSHSDPKKRVRRRRKAQRLDAMGQ